jgi:hypothetical protein
VLHVRTVERKPFLSPTTAILLIVGAIALFSPGLSDAERAGLAIGLFTFVALGALILFATDQHSRSVAFDTVPLLRSDQLKPGQLARVRAVIEGPATLTAPMQGSPCVFYRATALWPSNDDTGPDEFASVFEGEIASATDGAPFFIDFRGGVTLVGHVPLPGTFYEEPRTGDPLRLGANGKYFIDCRMLSPGDEIEVVGIVEHTDAGPRINPTDEPLNIRVKDWRA